MESSDPDKIEKIYWTLKEISKELGFEPKALRPLAYAVGVMGSKAGRILIFNATERQVIHKAYKLHLTGFYTYKGIKHELSLS